MENSFSSNSITDDHIATKFGTCHDSLAVVPCAKYCSDHFISIWMRAKWNFHHIWIVMEKLLVKWAPGFLVINSSPVSSPAAEVRDKLNVIHGQVGNKGGPTQPTKHSTRWWHGFLAMRQGITAWSICPENKTIKTSVLKELQMNLFCEVLLLIDNSVMI